MPPVLQMELIRWRFNDALKGKFKEGNSVSFCVYHRNNNLELEALLVAVFHCVLQLTPVNKHFSEWIL
jgi:hypothetical protein